MNEISKFEHISELEQQQLQTEDHDLTAINTNIAQEVKKNQSYLKEKVRALSKIGKDIKVLLDKVNSQSRILAKISESVVRKAILSKTKDLITPELSEQLQEVKNIFIVKILQSVITRDESVEHKLTFYQTQIALKDRMLRKSLIASQYYRDQVNTLTKLNETLINDFREMMR